MNERKIILGAYDTAARGWTLNAFKFDTPQQQTNYIEVIGRRNGPLDLSTAPTDGEPTYTSRPLYVRLESSEGTVRDREDEINNMINELDGYRKEITLPDDPDHYAIGRLNVVKEFNTMAHAAVVVNGTCEPWRYSRNETVVAVTATDTEQTVSLTNNGRLIVVPLIVITGGTVTLTSKLSSWSMALEPGTYKLPDIVLRPGSLGIGYKGTGSATFSYREAVL